ncbi:hypothetical protein [Brevundimonas sp.]|uniref:hypothetical protein n=1 Tax=Brevundimonas sp. TaxID=1871086 RepID=UPI0028AD1762|nr:hypothetical protein [Brevundimonas sp.]
MNAARKPEAVIESEEAVILAELRTRFVSAEAETAAIIRSIKVADAESRQRIRTAEVQTKLVWLVELKRIFWGPSIVALLTGIWHVFKK